MVIVSAPVEDCRQSRLANFSYYICIDYFAPKVATKNTYHIIYNMDGAPLNNMVFVAPILWIFMKGMIELLN